MQWRIAVSVGPSRTGHQRYQSVIDGCRDSAGPQWISNYEYEKDAEKNRRFFRFEQVPVVCPATTTPRLPVFAYDPCLHRVYTFRGVCDCCHITDCLETVIAITMLMASACLVNFLCILGVVLKSRRDIEAIEGMQIFFITATTDHGVATQQTGMRGRFFQ